MTRALATTVVLLLLTVAGAGAHPEGVGARHQYRPFDNGSPALWRLDTYSGRMIYCELVAGEFQCRKTDYPELPYVDDQRSSRFDWDWWAPLTFMRRDLKTGEAFFCVGLPGAASHTCERMPAPISEAQ